MTAAPYPQFDNTAHCRRRTVDPERFHPTKGANGSTVAATKALCTGDDKAPPCPFLAGCREYGITHAVHGIWGGLGEDGRKAARKARNIVPVALKTGELVASRPVTRPPAPHGSAGAVGVHERNREPLCDPCREYRLKRRRAARERKRANGFALLTCPDCRKEMLPESLPRHRLNSHDRKAS